MEKNFNQDGESTVITFGRYPASADQIFMQSHDEDGIPYARLTVCLPNVDLGDNEAIIDECSNEGVLHQLVNQGIVEDTGKTCQSGFNTYPIAKILHEVA